MMGAAHAIRDRGDDAAWAARRIAFALLLAALVAHALLAWLARDPGILTGQDDVEYIVLGQSLRHGGYHLLFRSDPPARAQYPPGYPVLLALWGGVLGDGYDALVALSLLLSLGSLIVIFLAVRRVADPRLAAAAALVTALNPEFVHFGGAIRSEAAYTLLSLLALYAVLRAAGAPGEGESAGAFGANASRLPTHHAQRWLALAAVAALYASLTRMVGVTLLAALLLHWALEKRWRMVVPIATIGVCAVGAWLVSLALGPTLAVGSNYAAELRSLWSGSAFMPPLPRRSLDALAFYATRALPWELSLPSVAGTPIDNVALAMLLAATLGAGAWVLWRRWRPAALYLLCYALLMIVWLWAVERFLLPVVPLLIVTMLLGAAWLAGRVRQTFALPAALALALLLGISGGARSVAQARTNMVCDRSGDLPPASCLFTDQKSYFEALRWIRANTPPDAHLLAVKSGALYRYTGRQAVSWARALSQDSASFLPWLQQRGAAWILLGSLELMEPARLVDLVAANCRQLAVAEVFPPRTWLFRVPAEVTPEQADASCAAVAAYRRENAHRDFEHNR